MGHSEENYSDTYLHNTYQRTYLFFFLTQ